MLHCRFRRSAGMDGPLELFQPVWKLPARHGRAVRHSICNSRNTTRGTCVSPAEPNLSPWRCPLDLPIRSRLSNGEPGRNLVIQRTFDFVTWEDVATLDNPYGTTTAIRWNQKTEKQNPSSWSPSSMKGSRRPGKSHRTIACLLRVAGNVDVGTRWAA